VIDPTIAAAMLSIVGTLAGVAVGQWLTTRHAAAQRAEERRHSQRSTIVELALSVREWIGLREAFYPGMRGSNTSDWLELADLETGRRVAENNQQVERALTLATFELGDAVAIDLVSGLRRLITATPEEAVAPLMNGDVRAAMQHLNRVRACLDELEQRLAPMVRVEVES
jgi:hypothetical protein